MPCFVYKCSNHIKNSPGISFFTIPERSAVEYWEISKVKKFKQMTKEQFLTEGYKKFGCCDVHFAATDITFATSSHKRRILIPGAVPRTRPQQFCNMCSIRNLRNFCD